MLESALSMLVIAVFAPLVMGLATLLLPRSATSLRPLAALVGPAASFAILLSFATGAGLSTAHGSMPLVPDLGISLDLRADALGGFFAMLVSGIGCLIVLYARGYFGKNEADLARFYPTLGFFTTAMLGLVLSNNMILMFMFWELTSISSFLLIGWDRDDEKAVRLAMQAFVTTGLGGMALLGGVLLLGSATDAWSFTELGPALAAGKGGALVPWAFALMFLGGAAKSAQWPFHFWLPGAMAAPTPVSAFLHSATMVKAGVYLFGRLLPMMGGIEAWGPTLTTFGAITMALGGILALRSGELKKIFAYSTVSQLGLFTCGYGLASLGAHHDDPNLAWPVMQILNHALYKAPLFMIAGAIIHALGSNKLSDCRGLWRTHRILALVCLVGLAGLMALPGTLSFGAKEAFLHQIIHAAETHPMVWAVAVATGIAAICSTAITVRFARTFFSAPEPRHHAHGHDDHHAHESGPWAAFIWIPAAALAALQLVGGLAPSILEPAIRTIETNPTGFDHLPTALHAITHPNLGLALSMIFTVLGLMLGFSRFGTTAVNDPHNALFPSFYRGVERLGRAVITVVQTGSLRAYLAIVLVALLGGLSLASWADPAFLRLPNLVGMGGASFMVVLGAVCLSALICATALILPMVKQRVLRVLVLGSCGFSVVGMYMIYQAPDLALTQLMFELISVVLFLLVLRLLPEEEPKSPDVWRRGRVALASVVGIAIGWTTLHAGTTADLFHVERRAHELAALDASQASILPAAAGESHGAADATTREFEPTGRLGDWFEAHSRDGTARTEGRGGGGDNIVNVILVDFRGYDTMGEITVLSIALIGVLSMLAASPAARSMIARGALSVGSGSAPVGAQPHLRSSLLRTAMSLILPLSLVFAGYVFFKGHNSPGGGFIAGLIASVGLAVYRMAEGGRALKRLIPIHPGALAAIGLAFALGTGFAPIVAGIATTGEPLPLFYSIQMHIPRFGAAPFHLPSVQFFDFGVFLVVVGVSVGMLNRFEEELET